MYLGAVDIEGVSITGRGSIRGRGFPNKSGFRKPRDLVRHDSQIYSTPFVSWIMDALSPYASRALFSRTPRPHRRVKRIINTCTSMRNRCDYMCILFDAGYNSLVPCDGERTRFTNARSDKWNSTSFKIQSLRSWDLPRTRHSRKIYIFFFI